MGSGFRGVIGTDSGSTEFLSGTLFLRIYEMTKRIGSIFLLSIFLAPVLSAEGGDLTPWEYWRDPSVIARIPVGLRSSFSSSHSPGKGAYDRHSEGDSRFLRIVDGEGLIFEAGGSGVLSRIWFTQGDGKARLLDESIRLRIRIDGREDPEVDMSLREFFSGQYRGFRPPVIQDLRNHGGGNVSRIPLRFHQGCRVTLVGAEHSKIWFQVGAMLLENDQTDVERVTADEAARLQKMLRRAGDDPWPDGMYRSRHGLLRLSPGNWTEIADFSGYGEINALLFDFPPETWPQVELRLIFDGRETLPMPLAWFFGVAGPQCSPPESLFIGGKDGILYSYFPMPFRKSAQISLRNRGATGISGEYSLRLSKDAPSSDAGCFRATKIDVPGLQSGSTPELLSLEGWIRLAGLFLTSGGPDESLSFLEGDELFRLDGGEQESWHGTGVEDFFGGGFYFRGSSGDVEVFSGPLSGLSCLHSESPKSVSMYRLMPADGPVTTRSLRLFWEGGAEDKLPVRWRGVAWFYERTD